MKIVSDAFRKGEKMTGGPRIISPMATGNGAYVLHRLLEKHIQG